MAALAIIVGGGKLEGKILRKMHERIIKNFMDIIILAELRNGPMRLRRNFLHPQQIPPPSKLRHSLLSSLFLGKKRSNRRNMGRKKKSLQTHR